MIIKIESITNGWIITQNDGLRDIKTHLKTPEEVTTALHEIADNYFDEEVKP